MGESGGQRRWVRIQTQSPPLGSAAPPEPTTQRRGRAVPGACTGRGARSPTRSHAPAGCRDAKRGHPGAELRLRRGNGNECRAPRPWRPALPGIPPNPREPKVPKIRKRNCRQVSRSLGTVSPASRRRLRIPGTASAVKGGPPSTSPGHLPRFLTRKGPQPPVSGAPRVALGAPGSEVVVGRVPPAPSRKKGKLGRCEKPVACSLSSVKHSLPRRGSAQSRGFRGVVGRSRALGGGDVRRRRGRFPAETAAYEHRAILGRFPLRRSPRGSCPREAARTAPGTRRAPGPGGRKASGPAGRPLLGLAVQVGGKCAAGSPTLGTLTAAPTHGTPRGTGLSSSATRNGEGGGPPSRLLQMPRDHVTVLTTDLDSTVI